MKSIVKPFPISINPRPFPKLMQSTNSGIIVLFSGPSIGTVVGLPMTIGRDTMGRHHTDYNMGTFQDFFGEVTLTESPSE